MPETGDRVTLKNEGRLFNIAFGLAVFTVVYNLAEGAVSTYLGHHDESLTLFGFGIDSFIEVISGLGIAQMIVRIRRNPDSRRGAFERTALRITGVAFYLLTAGLVGTSIFNLWTGHAPETARWGVVISVVSILVMWALVIGKRLVGRALDSEPILADANCTLTCVYMSVILLVSSGIYEIFGIGFIDSIGTLGLAWFAYSEGRECFGKARRDACCSCD